MIRRQALTCLLVAAAEGLVACGDMEGAWRSGPPAVDAAAFEAHYAPQTAEAGALGDLGAADGVDGSCGRSSSFSPSPVLQSFGDVAVGATSAPATIVQRNEGGVAIPVALEIAVSEHFVLLGVDCPAPIGPGGECRAQVAFAPRSEGPKSGTVTFTVPGICRPTSTGLLTGRGLPRPDAGAGDGPADGSVDGAGDGAGDGSPADAS